MSTLEEYDEPTCPFCGDGPEAIGTMYHIECVEKLLARIAELEAELSVVTDEVRAIDATLARRPALADIDDRRAKIERACSMAGRAEEAEAALDKVYEESQRREDVLQAKLAVAEAAEKEES